MPWERAETRRLAFLAGACTGYDACPGPGGLVYNIDGYAEEGSRLPWASVADWAYRALAGAAADVIASGGKPLAALYSIGSPNTLHAEMAAKGVGEAARDLGVQVLKADYNTAARAWIDVAVVGSSPRPVSRRGARPGDILLQVGLLGYGLVEALALQAVVAVDEALEAAPARRLPPPAWEVVSRHATAACDNSDGWAETLHIIAEESGVSIIVETLALDPRVEELLEAHGVPESRALYSWEDYNIAATIPADRVEEALEDCRRAGVECIIAGRVAEGPPRVSYRGEPVERRGWYWHPG